MVFITVLYKDLVSKTVPVEDIADLPNDDVLFLKLHTDQREGKLANIAVCFGFDSYAVLHKKDKDDWYMITGWDEDAFIWRRECDGCDNRRPVDIPAGTMHTIFRGYKIEDDEWAKAEVIINKEM